MFDETRIWTLNLPMKLEPTSAFAKLRRDKHVVSYRVHEEIIKLHYARQMFRRGCGNP